MRLDPDPHTPRNALDAVTRERRVVVCVGSGGVGKTTTSAVIALHGALQGRKVLVLTIDPARRLANSLGVDALDDTARPIPLERFSHDSRAPSGSLDAMMLDMKHAFDRLIEQHAPDAASRQRILDNRFYNYFSSSLAGTQEYSAMERLHELYVETDYDLIVLDTPPTTHALDFLDAPNRLFEALDSRALQWIASPSKQGWFNLVSLGTSQVLKVLSKFTGGSFLEELGDFVASFNPLWDGFKNRAARTRQILSGPDVAFYIVTTPDSISLDEALFFFDRLASEGIPIGGLILNRVHQGFVPRPVLNAPPVEIERRLEAVLRDDAPDTPDAPRVNLSPDALADLDLTQLSELLRQNAREFHVLADRDEETIALLRRRVGDAHPIHPVPFFSTDIYSFDGLERIRRELFDLASARSPAERTPGRL